MKIIKKTECAMYFILTMGIKCDIIDGTCLLLYKRQYIPPISLEKKIMSFVKKAFLFLFCRHKYEERILSFQDFHSNHNHEIHVYLNTKDPLFLTEERKRILNFIQQSKSMEEDLQLPSYIRKSGEVQYILCLAHLRRQECYNLIAYIDRHLNVRESYQIPIN